MKGTDATMGDLEHKATQKAVDLLERDVTNLSDEQLKRHKAENSDVRTGMVIVNAFLRKVGLGFSMYKQLKDQKKIREYAKLTAPTE